MQFSEKTIEAAQALSKKIIGFYFPMDFSGLGIMIGVYNLELLSQYDLVLTKDDVQKLKYQINKLKALGIVNNNSAIAYIQKIERLLEKWKPIQANFFESVAYPALKQLQADFMAENQ